jgi:hypothetical protein
MRRRRKNRPDAADEAAGTPDGAAGDAGEGSDDLPWEGPWDVEDHPLTGEDPNRVDLGSLSIAGRPELEVRLQVDESSGAVMAVLLASEDGALELRPFASSRHHEMWEDVRAEIVADLQRQGAHADEVDGPYGKALHFVMQGQTEDGQVVQQPTLLLGIDGPRWMLRVTAYGGPATEWHYDGLLETALRDVVVVRGTHPLPPGDPLPLQLPPEATRQA